MEAKTEFVRKRFLLCCRKRVRSNTGLKLILHNAYIYHNNEKTVDCYGKERKDQKAEKYPRCIMEEIRKANLTI